MEDVVTGIVSALAAGAGAGLTDTAKQVVTDTYRAMKALVAKKYPSVDLAQIETKPESKAKRDSVAEDLVELGAADDTELIAAARELIAVIEAHAPDAGAAIGVDLADVSANALRIGGVHAEGTAVRMRRVHAAGDIDIHDITAGAGRVGERPDPS